MKKILRVSLAFATYSTLELNSLAILVIACLKNNPLFPNLPVSIAALQALQAALQTADTAASNPAGGSLQRALRDEAATALVAALRQTAAYVQSVGLTDVSQVLSSGFDIVNPNSTPSPLTTPVLTGLDNSTSTQLKVSLRAVANAKAYHVQYSVASGPWLEGGIFGNTRLVTITDLTPGTVYNVRLRAIGGSTGYSDWSLPLALMCT